MELSLTAPHPRFGRGPPPQRFVEALRSSLSSLPESENGVELRVALDNSLAMASSASRRGNRATIRLDWGQIERSVRFFNYVWSRLGTPGAADALLSFFECEVLLSASRKALVVGQYVHARECHRMYVERCGPAPPAVDLDEAQIARAVRFSSFILHHEIGHQTCRDEPSLAAGAFDAFQRSYRKLVSFTPLRAEELYCDRHAIEALTAEKQPEEIFKLAPEICLLMLYLEIWSVTSLFFHMDTQNPNAVGHQVAIQLVADRVFRSDQALALLVPASQSPRASEARRAWRTVYEALQQASEDALISGTGYLMVFRWGEYDHVKKCLDDLMNGLTPESESAILADIAVCA